MIRQLGAAELARLRAATPNDPSAPLVLDVREPWEVARCCLPDSVAIPMSEVPARLAELDPARHVVCLCHRGGRSQQVAMFLEHHGFTTVSNLAGGIDAWSREVDPSVARY